MQPDRGTRAVVNLDAIVNNIKVARKNLKPETKLCAVVKANAYGHGAIPVAVTCMEAGADYFAVALVQEAVELREAGITKPILVLGAMPVRPSMADICVRFNISHAVFDEERLNLLNEAGLRRGKKAKIHLALETGMHRIGIKIEEAAAFAEKVKQMKGIEVVGAFSHFSAADVEDKSYADFQYAQFMKGVQALEAAGLKIPIKHICNSAGIAELPQYQLDMVRLGLGLYGINARNKHILNNVATLKTTILQIRDVPKGDSIGYSRRTTLERDSRIAAIPIGYADGLNRHLGNRGCYCLVNGQKADYVGNICMDVCMIDVTDIDCKEGDQVEIFGDNLPVTVLSDALGTIPYEVLTGISNRVQRVYIQE